MKNKSFNIKVIIISIIICIAILITSIIGILFVNHKLSIPKLPKINLPKLEQTEMRETCQIPPKNPNDEEYKW